MLRFRTTLAALVAAFLCATPAFSGDGPTIYRSNTVSVNGNAATTSGAMSLFVNCSTGSDSNNCLSSASPCGTIDGARAKIPLIIQDNVSISVSANTCTAGAYVNGFTFMVNNARQPTSQTTGPSLLITGTYIADTPATGLQTGAVASSVQASGGLFFGSGSPSTWGTFTVTGAGWTVNDLAGRLVQLTGGTCTPTEYVRVDSNTATVATIVGAFQVAPDATCTFNVVKPGTTISGVLARPPGVIQLGYSATTAAAFYVANNIGDGWTGGTNAGASPTSGNTNGQVDPIISIEGFAFATGTSATGITLNGGTEYAAVRFNNFTNPGQGIQARSGASTWVEANYMTSTTASSNLFRVTGPQANGSQSGSYSRFFNNYITGTTNANGITCKSGQCDIIQNSFNNINRGIFVGGGNPVVATSGNHLNTCTTGISVTTGNNLSPVSLLSDGDTFTSNTTAVSMTGLAFLQFSTDPQLGSGNTTGLLVDFGCRVLYQSAAHTSMTSSTDIKFNTSGQTFTLVQLRAGLPKKMLADAVNGAEVLEQ